MVAGIGGVGAGGGMKGADMIKGMKKDFQMDKGRELQSKNLNGLMKANSTNLQELEKGFKDSLGGFKTFG